MNDLTHALTILAVRDVACARAFYDSVLAWEPSVETPVYVEWRHANGMRLGLYQRDGFARNVGKTPIAAPAGELHAAELYFYANDPSATLVRALAHGSLLFSSLAARDWGDEVA